MMTEMTADIRAEIRRANDTFEATFARGDAAGMATLYTKNGMLLPPGSEPVIGPDAIVGMWQAVMNLGAKNTKLETVEVEQLEDTAIERGQFLLNGEGGQLIDRGKYMVIWKRVDGQWKLHQDIWNTSIAPQ
jgi:uncharacterized protein (TIGR02246 family)